MQLVSGHQETRKTGHKEVTLNSQTIEKTQEFVNTNFDKYFSFVSSTIYWFKDITMEMTFPTAQGSVMLFALSYTYFIKFG